jgi:hypothetical protein
LSRENGQELHEKRKGVAEWELELTALLKMLKLGRSHSEKILVVIKQISLDLVNKNRRGRVGARALTESFAQLTEDTGLLRSRHWPKRRTLVGEMTLLTELTSDGAASPGELMHSEEVVLSVDKNINITSVERGV